MTNRKKAKGGKPVKKGKGSSAGFPLMVGIIVLVIVVGAAGGILAWYLTSKSASGLELPDFVYEPSVNKRTVDAYQAALDIPEYLEQIPCYCGCGEIEGHKNNLDCFIKSRDGDKVAWDEHGAG